MPNTEKYLRLLLRIIGASAILAIVAVIMPHSWLVYWVELAEPGTPVRVLIPYFARLLSAYYVLLGVLLVFFASDIRRYAPAIRTVAIWCLLTGAAFVTYLVVVLPWSQWTGFVWFVFSDATFGVVFAVATLVLGRRVSAE